jgi:colanic acid/amylovoran biosynthesis glycosyltransferase
MGRAWLLAVPSVTAADGDREGLPTVAVEAAAAGLPVVGTRHSGIPEAVIDGRSGFLVAEGDVPALGDRLDALLGSADLRRRMSAEARALAEERFDLARQTRILERHYDRLLTAR